MLAFYAPEICTAHHGDLSAKAADIWALGITLYCMLFGKLPFVGGNILQLYENIRNEQLSLSTDTNPHLASLLERMYLFLFHHYINLNIG